MSDCVFSEKETCCFCRFLNVVSENVYSCNKNKDIVVEIGTICDKFDAVYPADGDDSCFEIIDLP